MNSSERVVASTELSTDVLVIGGGPAGTWAAIKAATAGAQVTLVDKGYCGASGATASAGTGIWYVDDVPELREQAMTSREALGGYLADRDWMARVLDETHARMDELATVQRYPFPVGRDGRAPKGTSLTKTAYYEWATFYHADGTVLAGAGSSRGRSVIAKTLLNEPVYARLDWAGPDVQRAMRKGQPNFFLVFDRLGVNPFTDLFEVTLLLEATVRGTGGVRVADYDCSTGVPGLYAAGDTATRELICGGFTGGGSHNAAWAASSGSWAGAAAADFFRKHGRSIGRLHPVGGAGLRPSSGTAGTGPGFREVVAEVQHAREAAAMTAHGRWMFHAALARTDTRGMHKRLDYPEQDRAQHYRLLTGGLNELWSRPDESSIRLSAVPSFAGTVPAGIGSAA